MRAERVKQREAQKKDRRHQTQRLLAFDDGDPSFSDE